MGKGGGDAMARMISHPDFEYPYGSFIPALYALAATRHIGERGTRAKALPPSRSPAANGRYGTRMR